MLELVVIVIGPPVLILVSNQSIRFLALVLLASYCLWRLFEVGAKHVYLRWNWEGCRRSLPGIYLRAAVAWIVVLSLVQWFYPTRLICIPAHAPALMLGISVGYAILSVLPQEVVFRAYAAWRLDQVGLSYLPSALISASIFGWVHILYGSWLSVLLCVIAGVVLYRTYYRTRSLAAVWLEHSLYGAAVFVLGLDPMFYRGTFIDEAVPACNGSLALLPGWSEISTLV